MDNIKVFLDDAYLNNMEIEKDASIGFIKEILNDQLYSFPNIDRDNIIFLVRIDDKYFHLPVMNIKSYDNYPLNSLLPYPNITDMRLIVQSNKPLLTPVKDVDLEIMGKMDDRTLLNFCSINKRAAQLCRDDNFWRKRFIQKFIMNQDRDIINKYVEKYLLPTYKTWKNMYLLIIHDLQSFGNILKIFEYVRIPIDKDKEKLVYDISEANIESENIEDFLFFSSQDKNLNRIVEKIKHIYLFGNLGGNITIKYPITGYTWMFDDDEYEEYSDEYLENNSIYNRVYPNPRVADLVRSITDFYQEEVPQEKMQLIPRELRDIPNIKWKDVLIYENPNISISDIERVGENVYRVAM